MLDFLIFFGGCKTGVSFTKGKGSLPSYSKVTQPFLVGKPFENVSGKCHLVPWNVVGNSLNYICSILPPWLHLFRGLCTQKPLRPASNLDFSFCDTVNCACVFLIIEMSQGLNGATKFLHNF